MGNNTIDARTVQAFSWVIKDYHNQFDNSIKKKALSLTSLLDKYKTVIDLGYNYHVHSSLLCSDLVPFLPSDTLWSRSIPAFETPAKEAILHHLDLTSRIVKEVRDKKHEFIVSAEKEHSGFLDEKKAFKYGLLYFASNTSLLEDARSFFLGLADSCSVSDGSSFIDRRNSALEDLNDLDRIMVDLRDYAGKVSLAESILSHWLEDCYSLEFPVESAISSLEGLSDSINKDSMNSPFDMTIINPGCVLSCFDSLNNLANSLLHLGYMAHLPLELV